MTAYEEVLGALGDADWDAGAELDDVVILPEEWLRELLREGNAVLDDEVGRALARRLPSKT